MKFVATQRCDYAVRAVLYLASRSGSQVNGDEICSATGVPVTAVRELMQVLGRAQLVQSRAGRNGGYSLSGDPTETTVRHIVEAVEGPIDPSFCELQGVNCSLVNHCSLHYLWQRIQEELREELSSLTVADLLDGSDQDGAGRSKQARPRRKQGK